VGSSHKRPAPDGRPRRLIHQTLQTAAGYQAVGIGDHHHVRRILFEAARRPKSARTLAAAGSWRSTIRAAGGATAAVVRAVVGDNNQAIPRVSWGNNTCKGLPDAGFLIVRRDQDGAADGARRDADSRPPRQQRGARLDDQHQERDRQ
jgi:hypothetical protein